MGDDLRHETTDNNSNSGATGADMPAFPFGHSRFFRAKHVPLLLEMGSFRSRHLGNRGAVDSSEMSFAAD